MEFLTTVFVVLVIMLPFISIAAGLYFIILGIWELRKGSDRKQYINYMFNGLVCLVILPALILAVANILGIQYWLM